MRQGNRQYGTREILPTCRIIVIFHKDPEIHCVLQIRSMAPATQTRNSFRAAPATSKVNRAPYLLCVGEARGAPSSFIDNAWKQASQRISESMTVQTRRPSKGLTWHHAICAFCLFNSPTPSDLGIISRHLATSFHAIILPLQFSGRK